MGEIGNDPQHAPEQLPPADGLGECFEEPLLLGLKQLLNDGSELATLPGRNLQRHFHDAGEVDGLVDKKREMEPAGSKALPAIGVVNNAQGAVGRGEKGLRRTHSNGLTRAVYFIFPCTGLANDPIMHGFFMYPARRETIATADLKERQFERLLGDAEKISFHEIKEHGSSGYEINIIRHARIRANFSGWDEY